MPEEIEELRRQWDKDMLRLFPWWKEPDLPPELQEEMRDLNEEFQRLMREGTYEE